MRPDMMAANSLALLCVPAKTAESEHHHAETSRVAQRRDILQNNWLCSSKSLTPQNTMTEELRQAQREGTWQRSAVRGPGFPSALHKIRTRLRQRVKLRIPAGATRTASRPCYGPTLITVMGMSEEVLVFRKPWQHLRAGKRVSCLRLRPK